MNIKPVDFIVCGLALDVAGIVLLISFGFPATYLEWKVTILEMLSGTVSSFPLTKLGGLRPAWT